MLKISHEADIDQTQLSALASALLPEIRAGRWFPQSFSITSTRRHHGKTLVFCHLTAIDHSVRQLVETDLVIKRYGASGGLPASCAALHYLGQAGFDASQQYSVPRLYGCAPKQGILVQAHVAGITWSELLRQAPPTAAQVAMQVAGWLVRLQRTPAPRRIPSQGPREVPYYCLIAPAVLLQKLAALFPDEALRLECIGERLQRQRSLMPRLPEVLSHGDFHPKNILLTPEQPGRTTVLDFDAYGMHEAAFDVGYCIGQLLSMAYFHSGTIVPGAIAARAFWQCYAEEGSAAWQHVSFVTACTLVQVLHYTFSKRHAVDTHSAMLPLWLDLITQWITCEDARILQRFATS